MNQEHHQKDVRTNSKGASYDVSPELSGAQDAGMYFDSENGRVSSDRGQIGAWEKIRGEEQVHDTSLPGASDWFCMCSISVNRHIFEIWVEKTDLEAPYIAIDGQIMGQSINMPWLFDHHIQWDKNEACVGGEVFLTDFNSEPTIFNIQDIIDNFNAGTQVYFDDFNLNLYSINLSYALDVPIFTRLVDVGAGGGLPPGSYQYSLRYVNTDGDATNWSPLTPPIPVIKLFSSSSPQYPYAMTHGAPPDVSQNTRYAPEIKFRVTNLNDYDFIEIRRIAYDAGLNIEYVPAGELVAKIDIVPGEISIHTFIDPTDSNIVGQVLAENEEAGQLASITRAKGIRYYDKRLVLMNIETASKDISSVQTIEYNGKKIFPIVENLGKVGFKSPVNHAYKKNYPSNEKFSFGVNFFDGTGASGFVYEDNDLKNVEAPSRRAPVDTDSINFSYGGVVTAADVNSNVGQTFEVFSHENAISKNDQCSFKNILKKGSKSDGNVNEFCADAGFGGTVTSEELGYLPFTPVSEDDSDISGHDYIVNPKVYPTDGNNDSVDYRPKGFGCDYYSRGFAFSGIQNIPSWVRAFSVVRSARAGRVVCQGIAVYDIGKTGSTIGGLINPASPQATKSKNSFIFHSPDIFSDIVPSSEVFNMFENPEDYELVFSSPLGYFSEAYTFRNKTDNDRWSGYIDMMTYARILRDNGEINPGEDPAMGVNGYVAYNRFRNTTDNAGQGAFNVPEGGEKVFTPTQIAPSPFIGGLKITLNEDLYQKLELNDPDDNDFDDQDMKDFAEPFYIVNIIKKGALVPDLDVNKYYSTGHYQKIESIIGKGNGQLGQSFELVDERWEDCIPSLTPTGFNSNGESFVYFQNLSGVQQPIFNVTYKTAVEVTAIISDISTNGFYVTPGGTTVFGVYTHSIVNGLYYINFNNPTTIPDNDTTIIVKYDNTRPIRFFGGDTVVGETVMPLVNKKTDANGEATVTAGNSTTAGIPWDIGFPFRGFEMNPRMYIVKYATGSNHIQNEERCRLGYMRQLCIMYAAETVISTPYSYFGNDQPEIYAGENFPGSYGNFPARHYVMRPIKFKDEFPMDSNNIYEDYAVDYDDRYPDWFYGGFNFSYGYNSDYSVDGPVLYFSKPKFGFEEQNYFCTGIVWSLQRSVNQQNSPGLKTFPETNRFFMSDDNGGIKKAWSARTDGKGYNLYAITESGIALLITQKSILSNITADDLSVTAVDKFISQEYWLSQEIGSNGEMWRGMAEGSIELNTESGSIEREGLFIPNRHSVYLLMDNLVVDIAKNNYYTRIHPSLSEVAFDYSDHMTGHYDKNHNEYWLQILDSNLSPLKNRQRCFVYSQSTGNFIGRYSYQFDKYLFSDSKNYGFKDNKMFLLDSGYSINDEPIEARIIVHTSRSIVNEKEFISIELNTGIRGEMQPTQINVLDENMQILASIENFKQYDGWWAQIPRKMISISPNRDRIQYRLIMFEIIHNFEQDFKLVSSVIQFKPIK